MSDQETLTDPFDAWASYMRDQGELNEKSVEKYRPMWTTWRWWLAGSKLEWDTATANDLQRFITGPTPRTGKRHPISPSKMSTFTANRYWRILRGVYATALKDGRVPSNPALDIEEGNRPKLTNADRISHVLEPVVFSKLHDPATLEAVIKIKGDGDWWHNRDRAMLAVLVNTGMTTSELVALRGVDIRRADGLPMELHQGEILASGTPQMLIDVMETPTTVGRVMEISPSMAPLLKEWWLKRRTLLTERAARTCSLDERSGFMQKHSALGPLFFARRDRSAVTEFPPMDSTSVYYTVSKALASLRSSLGSELNTNGPRVANGAAIIRNSVINHWLKTLSIEQTVALAGLQSAESLRLRSQKPEALRLPPPSVRTSKRRLSS